jgi:DNA-binding response OmpR family regulator
MANVFLIGVEQTIADQISRALGPDRHRIEQKAQNIEACDLMEVDIVFAGGEPPRYLPLLRWVREQRPALPFVVVTAIPDTTAWLDALEAGATDYCSCPFEKRQIQWMMETCACGPKV